MKKSGNSINIIEKYFIQLNESQKDKFKQMMALYSEWNNKINLISRKDIDNLYEHHVLHSLSIARLISFTNGTEIIDVGTGGGFPGIPLAIFFPEVNFHLIDSTAKKIMVVQNIIDTLGLSNATAQQVRSNELKRKFDFVVCRAVDALPAFVDIVRHFIKEKDKNPIPNGIFYLKGGDLSNEIKTFKKIVEVYNIEEMFEEEYFKTKKIVYLPL